MCVGSLFTAQHTTGLDVVGGGGVGDKGEANISIAVSPEFLKTNISLLIFTSISISLSIAPF